MENIIVPIDFSQNSQHTYLFAQQLATQLGAQLKLIHIAQIYVNENILESSSINFIEEQLQTRLSDFAIQHQFYKEGDLSIIETEVRQGPGAEGIINYSKQEQVDMIIMGTKGSSNLARKLFGSVSIQVAKEAFCPVLLVPPNARFRGFDSILFASPEKAPDAVMELAIKQVSNQFDAFPHVVHVEQAKDASFLIMHLEIDMLDNNKSYRMVDIASESVAEGMNEYIEHNDIDISVIITRHRSFIEDLFHKSMTKEMIMNTEIPLLILHIID